MYNTFNNKITTLSTLTNVALNGNHIAEAIQNRNLDREGWLGKYISHQKERVVFFERNR